MEIRRALPAEAEILTGIAFAAKRSWSYPERWLKIWAPQLTITPQFIIDEDVWVIMVDNEIAGFYALNYSDERAVLEHFWVSPPFKARGAGRTLFQHALARCRKNGCAILQIESDPNAQGFYEKMGARKVGESVGEIDGQPRVLPLLQIFP